MTGGSIDHGLDPVVLSHLTHELAQAFLAGSRPTMARMATDDTLAPQMVMAAVVRAHLFGAASMVAAINPPIDGLVLATWLIEALGEAMAEAAEEAPIAEAARQ